MKASIVAIAIASLHPTMHAKTTRLYAEVLARDVDPLGDVAIVEHESRWHRNAEGGLDDACVGLGQRCLRFVPACKDGLTTPACLAVRERLRDPVYALEELVGNAKAWRSLCCKVLHREPRFREWFSGYAGFDGHGVACGHKHGRPVKTPRVILDVEALRQKLRRVVR